MKFLYTIAFFLFFFGLTLNSNPFIYKLLTCCIPLIVMPNLKKIKFQPLHYLFFAWLAWAFVCSLCSDHTQISLLGYHLRMEGFLTYLVMSCLAVIYWGTHDQIGILKVYCMGILLITITLFGMFSLGQFNNIAFSNVSMASLIAVIGVILYSIQPIETIIIIPFLFICNNRSAIISLVLGLACYILLKHGLKRILKPLMYFSAVIMIIVMCSPLLIKVKSFHLDTLGHGARTQWARQAIKMSTRLPLTGYGLDTLSMYLKPANGGFYEIGAKCDKTHNIGLDCVLMLGWLGFGLSLFMLLGAFRVTWLNRTDQNIMCFSVIVAWLAFNMFNPSGIYSTVIAMICFLGIKEKDV